MSKFVVQLPLDKYGNTAMPDAVIEVEPYEDTFGESWRVLAPQNISSRWSSISPRTYLYAEVAGPARALNDREYLQALIDAKVDPRYIERAQARIEEE